MSSAGKSTPIHTTTHTRVDPAQSQSSSQNNTQPNLTNLRKTTSGFSSPKLSSMALSGAFPEGLNEIDNDARFDRLLFSQPLFAAELDSANWKGSLSCINDVEFAENDIHTIPWACHRRLRCPVCAFLDKAGRQRCGGGEEGMEKVASKFGWIIDKSEEVNAVLTDFHTKEVNKEMAAQLKEVIKMLKGQLSDAVDELFRNEMEMVEVYEKKQAKIVYRNRILTEIASTEKDYYNSLTVIKNTWKVDFVDSGLLPEGVINMIFSNIDDIVTTTDKMIKKIDVEKGKEYGDQMVGKIFVDLIPELKGYVDYCPMQDRAQRVYYEQIKSNSKFKELVTKTRIDKHQTTKGQDLPSFLIKPTQRITKYPLFLKDLIKHTDTKHPDYPSLLKAEEEIKKFLEEINIKTRRQVTLDAIEKLKPTIIWRSNRSIDFERSQCTFITESKSKCVYQAKEGGPSEKGKSIVLFDSVMLVLYKYHGKFREVATIPIDTITEVIDNDDPQNSPIKPPNKMTVSQQQQSQSQQQPSSPMMQLQSPASLPSISAQNVPPSTQMASMSQSSITVPTSPKQNTLALSSSAQSSAVDISTSASAVDVTALNGGSSNMGVVVPANQGGSASMGGEDVIQSQNGEFAQLVTSTSRLGSNIANSITIVTSKEENIVIKPKEEFEKQHLLTTLDEIVHNARKVKLHSLEYVLTEPVTSTPVTGPSASTSPTAQLNLNMVNEDGEEPTMQPMSPATQQQQQQQVPPITPRPTSPSLSHRKSDATPQESGLLTPPVVVLNPQGSAQGHKHGKSMQLPQVGAAGTISSPQQQQQQQQQDQQSLQKVQRLGGQDRKTKKINLFNGVRKNANQNDDSLSSSPVTAVSLSPQESNLEGVISHPGHRKANSSSVVVLPPPKQLSQPTSNVVSTGNIDINTQSQQQQQQQQQQQDPSSDSTESPRDPGAIVAAQGGGSGSSEDNENDEHGTKNANIEINVNTGESERSKHKKKRVTTTHFPSFRKKKQHEQENVQKAAVSGSGSAEEPCPRLPPSQSPPPPFDCQQLPPPSSQGGESGNADVKPQEQSLPPLPSVPDHSNGGGSKSLNITPKSTLRKGVTGAYDDDDVEIAMAPSTTASNSGNDSRPTKKHKKFSISSSLRKRRTTYDEDDSAESSADSPATHTEEPAESKRPVSKRKGKKRLGFLSLGRKSERYIESDPHLTCLNNIPQTTITTSDTSHSNGEDNHEKEISPPPPPLGKIKSHPKHSDVDIPPPLSEQRLTHTTSLSSLGLTSAEHQEEEEEEHMHSTQKKGGQIRLNPKSPRGLGTIPPPTSPPPPPHSASPSPGPSSHSSLRMEINIPPPPIAAPDPSASNSSLENQKVSSSNHMPSPRQLKMPCSMQRPAETPPPPPPSQQSPLPPQSSSMTSSSYSSSQQSQQSFGGNFPTSSSVSGEDSDSLSAHQEGGNRKSLPPPPPPKCAAPSPPPPQQPPQFVVSIPVGPPPSPPPSD